MKKRSFFIVGMSAILVLFIVLGAFVGGMTLVAPYLNGDAQAAAAPQPVPQVQAEAQPVVAASDALAAYEQAMEELYQAALPSVVNINVTQQADQQMPNGFGQSPFPFSFPQQPGQMPPLQGEGSGFVWDQAGHIVTNYHVVANASDIEVAFADGTTAKAEVLGTDPNSDLAVLKVDLPSASLKPLVLGDSDTLKVGQVVVAIGNPFGQQFSMTNGIISAVGRTIQSGNSAFSIPEAIQTDAAINPGNSGGPLIDRQGQVIGINSQIISRSGGNAGIGFAVPINIAKQVVPTLIKGDTYKYAWLGLSGTTLTSEVANFMKLPADTKGALVIDVAQDGPADGAGLKGSDKTMTSAGNQFQVGGDVITAINGQPVKNMDDLITYLIEKTQPGEKVTLDVIRANDQHETITVTLGTRPAPGDLTLNQQNNR